MPLPLLAMLGFGGLAGSYGIQRHMQGRDRARRKEELTDAFGSPGLPGLGGDGVLGEFALEGNQMGSAQVQAAIQMLSDPRTAAAGQALLTNAFTERGANSRHAAGQAGQDRRQEDSQLFQSEQNDINRGIRADEFDRTEARLDDNFNRSFDQRERFQQQDIDQRASQHANSLQLENIHRSVPTGYEVMNIDSMGNRAMRPIYGGEQWRQAYTEVTQTGDAMRNTAELINLARTHGRKLTGPTRTRMEALRGQIISDLARARDLGVLTPGELEFLGETGAPEITGAGGTFAASAVGGYEKIFELLEQKAVMQRQIYGSLNSYGAGRANTDFGTSVKLSEGGTSRAIKDQALPEGFVLDQQQAPISSMERIGQSGAF